MYDTILVAVDDGDTARETLEHAVAVADQLGATLHVVTVVEPPGSPMRFGVEEVDALNRAATTLVDDLVAAYADRDLEVHGDVRRGKPAEQILARAEEVDADMILVGRSEAGELESAILGSTPDRLVRLSSVPVAIVPEPDADE